MTPLPIITGEDNPVLRTKTEKIPTITKDILKLVKNMQETVDDAKGAGLAAPQIGKSLRVCIALINGKQTPLINPKITWRSGKKDSMEEGCLSLPGIWLPIKRPVAITLTYQDAKGKDQERKLKDFDARVVQHEIDHLEGVLIVDYPQENPTNPVMQGENVL